MRIGVVGAGAWGTALAIAAARASNSVSALGTKRRAGGGLTGEAAGMRRACPVPYCRRASRLAPIRPA